MGLFHRDPLDVEKTEWVLDRITGGGAIQTRAALRQYFNGDFRYYFARGGSLYAIKSGIVGRGAWRQDGDRVWVTLNGSTAQLVLEQKRLMMYLPDGGTNELVRERPTGFWKNRILEEQNG